MKNADYIIDLGPGAGDAGGYVVQRAPRRSRGSARIDYR